MVQPTDIFFYLNNASFRRWILHNDAEGERYWLQWLQTHPEAKPHLLQARQVLQYFQKENELAHLDDVVDKVEVWEKIQATIKYLEQEQPVAPVRRMSNTKRYFKYAAVFTGIMLCAAVSWFIFRPAPKNTTDVVSVIKPGGNHAFIKLPNNKTIFLDSVTDGVLYQSADGASVIKKSESIYITASAAGKAGNGAYTLYTPKGGRYHIVLPDSSQVWMNALSSVTVPENFTGSARQISMWGECYFDISHVAGQVFLVHNPTNTIRVLGTAFNVMAYDKNDVRISLVRGKIKILQKNKNKELSPGQRAVCNVLSNNIQVDADEENIEPETAWKDGFFDFKQQTIQEVMNRLSKWYRFEVVYEGNIQEKFYGRIPMNVTLDKVLKILELTGSVSFKITDNKVTVYNK